MLFLTSANLISPGIAHGFFTRHGGVSNGAYESLNCGPGSQDDRANVIENRRRVSAELGGAALINAGQVHGTHTITVTKPWRLSLDRAEDKLTVPLGDALVTATPGIALGILTADCAPVLLADSKARVIGGAHAGWKGALAGVVESVIAAMESLSADRANIAAAVGPCIGQTNYEVGPELREAFAKSDSANARFFIGADRPDHFRFDLEGYVVHRLRAAGIANIHAHTACTYAREADFFSYRRATHRKEADNGRQISAIALPK